MDREPDDGTAAAERGCASLRVAVVLTILLAFTLSSAALAASTYYVSPDGSDAHDGRQLDAPWKTVAIVNGTRLLPGDSVLFERGGEWRESLVPNCSGAPGKPILFGAYGRGAKPKFWGSAVLDNKRFEKFSGTTYKYATEFPVDRHQGLAVDNTLLPWTGFGDAKTLEVVKTRAGAYVIDDGHSTGQIRSTSIIYWNTGGPDPRRDGRLYTVCVRQDVVLSNYKDHLTFRDLVVDETAALESGYGFRIMGGKGIRLEGCEAYRVGTAHFGVIGGEVTGINLKASYAMPNQTYIRNSAYFSNNPGSHPVELIDCVAEHLENYPGQSNYNAMSAIGGGVGSVLVKNMTCVGNGGGGISIGTKGKVSIIGGAFENGHTECFASNLLLDGVTFTGDKSCIDNWGSDCLYQNCQFISVDPKNATGFPALVIMREHARNNVVRFCTMTMAPGTRSDAGFIAFAGKGSLSQWYGNIMIGSGTVLVAGGVDASDVALADYNYYNTGATFTYGRTDLSAWKELGFDVHSLAGNPKFVDPVAGDLSLESGSPAIGAARVTRQLTPDTDIRGRSRRDDTACDMGAHESAQPVTHSARTVGGRRNDR